MPSPHILLVLFAVLLGVHSYKYELSIKKDTRPAFFIESFGFEKNGKMIMDINNFEFGGKNEKDMKKFSAWNVQIYFLIKISKSDSSEFLTESVDYACGNTSVFPQNVIAISQDWRVSGQHVITVDGWTYPPGVYSLYFINCFHDKKVSVSFNLDLTEYNLDLETGDRDYLPAGLSPTPVMYGIISAIYAFLFLIWICGYMRGQGKDVNMVHYLICFLLVIKFASVLYYAVQQHFAKVNGRPLGWMVDLAYSAWVVVLVGVGWYIFRSFLAYKKFLKVMISLQILTNGALVVIEFAEFIYFPEVEWFTLRDILLGVDILCCFLISIPVSWSIHRMTKAALEDYSVGPKLLELQAFRKAYSILMTSIYVIRIVALVLSFIIAYNISYVAHGVVETITILLFLILGHRYRPERDDHYFSLLNEEGGRSVRMEEMRVIDDVD